MLPPYLLLDRQTCSAATPWHRGGPTRSRTPLSGFGDPTGPGPRPEWTAQRESHPHLQLGRLAYCCCTMGGRKLECFSPPSALLELGMERGRPFPERPLSVLVFALPARLSRGGFHPPQLSAPPPGNSRWRTESEAPTKNPRSPSSGCGGFNFDSDLLHAVVASPRPEGPNLIGSALRVRGTFEIPRQSRKQGGPCPSRLSGSLAPP